MAAVVQLGDDLRDETHRFPPARETRSESLDDAEPRGYDAALTGSAGAPR